MVWVSSMQNTNVEALVVNKMCIVELLGVELSSKPGMLPGKVGHKCIGCVGNISVGILMQDLI